MRLSNVMNGVEYKQISGRNPEISSLVIDSRAVRGGSLFFCLRGLKSDGHDFLVQAINSGASAAVIDRDITRPDITSGRDIAIVKVENSRRAMAIAAANFNRRPADDLNLIGVTGTKGKTSSTFFIEAILREAGRKTGLIGTVETRFMDDKLDIAFATSTTPDSIELQKILAIMSERGATDIIMEVSSHALALEKLYGTRFKTAMFTNLTHDHLDFHNNMQNYLEAKTKLFQMCEIGIVNADSEASKYIAENACCPIVTYGIENKSNYKAENVKLLSDSVSFDVNINGKTENFVVGIGGRFTVYNLLGSLVSAIELGISPEIIRGAFMKLKGVPGRLQSVPNSMGIRVIVDYAHSPDALKNIIEAVREFTERRLITVFGCGGDKDKQKRPVMGRLAGGLSDFCVITSDNPRTEDPDLIIDEVEVGVKETRCAYERHTDRKTAIMRAIQFAMPGDSVIIAGKGHEDYQIFADRTIRFDDYEVAEEIIAMYSRK